jgi:hypothetical protein
MAVTGDAIRKEYDDGVRRPLSGSPHSAPAVTSPDSTNPLVKALAALDTAELARRAEAEAVRPVTEVIDEIESLGITGDIVPTSWFAALKRKGHSRTVQDMDNVLVLAHIVAWHRYAWKKKEDGVRVKTKKFDGDCLILVRGIVAKALGCNECSITRAIRNLKLRGFIWAKVEDEKLMVRPIVSSLHALISEARQYEVHRGGSPRKPQAEAHRTTPLGQSASRQRRISPHPQANQPLPQG